jgi:radical SAM superfamily enzyme YgiQ (UPF0313 family)
MKSSVLLFNPRPNPHLRPVDLPLSLLCISRFLDQEGYNIKIVAENLYENHFDVLRESAKESLVFGISAMTGYQIYEGIEASKIVKEANPDIKVIWGGWHASLYPTQVLENPYIDIVVKGQGERALYDVIKKLENDETLEGILGVHWKNNGQLISNPDSSLEKMDDWPAIPYHLVDTEKCLIETEFGNRTINYVSSYGCPYRCAFCCEVMVNNRRWVGLNAEAVVDDLERLEKVYNVNGVSMYDSLFFVDIKRSKDILKGMIDRGLTIRLGNVDGRAKQLAAADDELWELLRETRTYSILCGAESGDQEALDVINKDMDVEDNIKFAEKCHKFGIKVVFSTLVGVPIPDLSYEELAIKTDNQINATIDMFQKVLSMDSRHRGLMFIYLPYPGTPLYESAIKLGFKEPKTLEEWGKFTLYQTQTPWITKRQEKLVPMISSYIFMFLDSDTIIWVKERVKNPIKKKMFIFAFNVFTSFAKFRWRFKFFEFPVDYYLFQFGKTQNKSI